MDFSFQVASASRLTTACGEVSLATVFHVLGTSGVGFVVGSAGSGRVGGGGSSCVGGGGRVVGGGGGSDGSGSSGGALLGHLFQCGLELECQLRYCRGVLPLLFLESQTRLYEQPWAAHSGV